MIRGERPIKLRESWVPANSCLKVEKALYIACLIQMIMKITTTLLASIHPGSPWDACGRLAQTAGSSTAGKHRLGQHLKTPVKSCLS